jgi:hypothetical protein
MKDTLKRIHDSVESLNTSKFFTGIIMLVLNLGSKYITVKLSDTQEAYIRNYVIREVLIFSICWMGTRDIYTALILTAVFSVLTQHLFNENSNYCIIPEKYRKLEVAMDLDNDGEVSPAEIASAVKLLTRAKEQKTNKEKDKVYKYFTNKKY